jgi:hypothetical protein
LIGQEAVDIGRLVHSDRQRAADAVSARVDTEVDGFTQASGCLQARALCTRMTISL